MTLHSRHGSDERSIEPLFYRSLLDTPAPQEADCEASSSTEATIDVDAMLRDAQDKARRETLSAVEAEFQQRLADERAALSRAVQLFETEKQRYFSEVEEEVVKLSLAIAERVLHREAEMDPMLLAGAARVALEKVQDTSDAVLHVCNEDTECWQKTFTSSGVHVLLEPCESLRKGEAVLKTRSGSVQLGLKAQLQEIERGFFELLTRRPVAAAAV